MGKARFVVGPDSFYFMEGLTPMKSLRYGAAAVSTIVVVTFSVWWTYLTATYNDQHKIIAFVLTASVALCIILYCVIFAWTRKTSDPATRR
jgi:hypothetical protein